MLLFTHHLWSLTLSSTVFHVFSKHLLFLPSLLLSSPRSTFLSLCLSFPHTHPCFFPGQFVCSCRMTVVIEQRTGAEWNSWCTAHCCRLCGISVQLWCKTMCIGRNPLSVNGWMDVVIIFMLVSQTGQEGRVEWRHWRTNSRNALLKEMFLVV